MFKQFFYLLKRDFTLQWRNRGNLFLPALFLLLSGQFTLYLGNPPALVQMQIGFILLMLAMLLPLSQLYNQDVTHGFLQILHGSRTPLLCYIYAKIIGLYFGQMIGLLPALLIYALVANFPINFTLLYVGVGLILLLGISFMGGMMSAPLATSHNQMASGNGFFALLLLPLLLPMMIFAASAIEHHYFGLDYLPHLLLLTGFSLLSTVLCPLVAVKFLQISTARW